MRRPKHGLNACLSAIPGIDVPRANDGSSMERFQALLAATQTTVSLPKVDVVTFCAPSELEHGVPATVLVDGVELARVLANAK